MKKAVLASLLLLSNAHAQLPQNWSPDFAAPVANGEMLSVAESSDAFYVGGLFTLIGNTSAQSIARIDKVTGAVTGLGQGVSNGSSSSSVTAIAVVGGDVYVAGNFTHAGGVPASRIARWNGSSWSALGSGVNASVQELRAMGTDLIVAGNFTLAGGASGANRLARWDGTQWSAIGSTGANSSVSGLLVDGTNLYVCGSFTSIGGVSATRAAKWDGSAWSALGTGLNNSATCIAKTGADIYFGGIFTTAGGVATERVARWDGTAWSAVSLVIPNPNGYSGLTVNDLAVYGGMLYVGGGFNAYTYGSTVGSYLSRWDGSAWSSVGEDNIDAAVNQMLATSNGLITVGRFGFPQSRVARWDGAEWQPMLGGVGKGLNGSAYGLVPLNGKVYVSGSFTSAGNVAVRNVACYDTVTGTWSPLGAGLAEYSGIAAFNGELYALSYIEGTQSPEQYQLARWDGAAWHNLVVINNGWGLVSAGGSLYVLGYSISIGALTMNGVAKWDGSTWSDAGAGISTSVSPDDWGLALTSVNGQLYHIRTTANPELGTNTARIYAWSGSSWSLVSTLENAAVLASTEMNGDLIVGGSFIQAGGVTYNHVARWNGSSWSALGQGLDMEPDAMVNCLHFSHGLLYAGLQNSAVSYLLEWNGVYWNDVGGGPDNSVGAIETSGDSLFVVGDFVRAGHETDLGEIRLEKPSSSYFGIYPLTPEIGVEQTAGGPLADGAGAVYLGSFVPGISSPAMSFTLRSDGTIPLLDLAVSKEGANPGDFTVSALPSALEDSATTTFTVTFTPSSAGPRSAVLRIANSDADENPFDITLTGVGSGAGSAIAFWRQTWFGTSENAGDAADMADPDGDGTTNYDEFAFGMDPTANDLPPALRVGLNGGSIELFYTRGSSAASEVGFEVPWTQTMNGTDWTYGEDVEQVLSDNGIRQEVKVTVPKGTVGRRFVRLEVW